MGRRTNQTVVFIAHARFMERLRDQAELAGIQVSVTEASSPAKCSFRDLEPIGKHDAYAGKRVKRVKRGLFRASGGRCLNADIHGAYTILRKVVPHALGNGMG